MKKIMKLKKTLKKFKITKKHHISHKISFQRKFLYQQIQSPHNTNEFLIDNHSSPFLLDDEEDSINIKPSSIIQFENENSGLDLFFTNDSYSTNDDSLPLNEKPDQEKEQIERCLDK